MFIVNRIFNWRFWIAELTKKSKTAKKIINKMLFEREIIVIPIDYTSKAIDNVVNRIGNLIKVKE